MDSNEDKLNLILIFQILIRLIFEFGNIHYFKNAKIIYF